MRPQTRRRFAHYLCIALLLALFLSSPAGAIIKVCYETRCCHDCDYYSNDGVWLYSIYWCWTDSGSGCAQ
jgi:hypothetical protein